MGEMLNNESIVTDEIGSLEPLYEWSRITRDSMGAWYRTVIATTKHLIIADVAQHLANGIILIDLRETCPQSGRMWGRTMPTYCSHQLVKAIAPELMPYPADFTAFQWMQQAARDSWAIPHIKGSHFIGGKVGDLDNNGVVNTADLLIFTGKFGAA